MSMLLPPTESPTLFAAKADEFLLAIAPHMKRLSNHARLQTGGHVEEGEELLHETILLCHERIGRLGFEGGPSEYVAYLFTHIRYQQQENYRQRALQPVLMDVENFSEVEAETAYAPDSTQLEMLVIAIKTFIHAHYSTKGETVFELHCQGLTYSEIHFATGIVKSSAQQLVQSIKASVRREFGAAFDDYQTGPY